MAAEGHILSKQTSLAVGSRRSRAAAFGDDTTDQAVDSASQLPGQMAPDEKGVSTSSGETTVRGEGEPIRTDPLRAMRMRSGGPGSSPVMPAFEVVVCPGRHPSRRAGGCPRGAGRQLAGALRQGAMPPARKQARGQARRPQMASPGASMPRTCVRPTQRPSRPHTDHGLSTLRWLYRVTLPPTGRATPARPNSMTEPRRRRQPTHR